MAEPVPIREGVEPRIDTGRELLDFCQSKIAQYAEEYGSPPTSIAMVLSGEKNGCRATDAYSWDASETWTQLITCSVASAMMMKRAIGD